MIRDAKEKDIPRILELLKQVLQIHADIRPDIFIPDTTKYTTDELTELLKNKEKPVYVAVNEDDVCIGYAFCQLQEHSDMQREEFTVHGFAGCLHKPFTVSELLHEIGRAHV